MRKNILIIFILISLTSCVQKGLKEEVPFTYENGLKYYKQNNFKKSLEIFTYLYKEIDKYPIESESIIFYNLMSINHILHKDNTNDKIVLNNKFKEIYKYYNYNYKYSKFKKDIESAYLIFLFIKQDYSLYIYYFKKFASNYLINNLSKSSFLQSIEIEEKNIELVSDIDEILVCLYSYSYIELGNSSKSMSVIKNVNMNKNLKNIFYAYINYFVYSNIIEAKKYYKKIEELNNENRWKYYLFFPITKSELEKINSFNYINFFTDQKFYGRVPYVIQKVGSKFLVGTFLRGIYIFNENGEYTKYISSYNTGMVSNEIREIYKSETEIYYVTYQGISIANFKFPFKIKRNYHFPLQKNYSGYIKNNKYEIAYTHYNGLYIYDFETRKLKQIFRGKIVQSAEFIGKEKLLIGTMKSGLYIYDINSNKIIKSIKTINNIKSIKKHNNKFYICSYKDGVYRLDENYEIDRISEIQYINSSSLNTKYLYIASVKFGVFSIDLDTLESRKIDIGKDIKPIDIISGAFGISFTTAQNGVFVLTGVD